MWEVSYIDKYNVIKSIKRIYYYNITKKDLSTDFIAVERTMNKYPSNASLQQSK